MCPFGSIDFDQPDRDIEVDAGAIIVATGMDVYDPSEIIEYGYGKYDNVITAMQFERLLSSFGPTAGKVLKPSDGKKPKKLHLADHNFAQLLGGPLWCCPRFC